MFFYPKTSIYEHSKKKQKGLIINNAKNMRILNKIINILHNKKINFKRPINKLLKKNSIRLNNASPLIIIWELGGFPQILAKNAIISLALNLRRFKTHFIICDGTPSACIQRDLENGKDINEWESKCQNCLTEMLKKANQYGMKYSLLKDYINKNQLFEFNKMVNEIQINDIINLKYLGVAVGELAWSSINRFMKGCLVDFNKMNSEDESIYKQYLYAALVNTFIANRVLEEHNPISVFMSHGIYVDYAPAVFLSYLKKY